MIEAFVAKVCELKNGEMKKVIVSNKKILLLRIDNEFHALAAWCTHQRAPLTEGILKNERLLCPWHQACFNCKTGDMEEPPALDALPHFNVYVKGDDVIIRMPENPLYQRTHNMAKYNPSLNKKQIVIAGGGAAGSIAAETLRQNGFEGKIIMLSKEEYLPYDRTELSKKYLKQNKLDANRITLRRPEFYKDNAIEIIYSKEIKEVDFSKKAVLLDDETNIFYDSLLLATGSQAIKLNTRGINLKNIFTLRTINDAKNIHNAALNASNAVIIGAGFIGMETASILKSKGLSVNVVAPSAVPFENNLGKPIGEMILNLFLENGISFKLNNSLSHFEGNEKVESVVLNSGEKLPADIVIVGVGARLSTAYLKGIKLNQDCSIDTDKYLNVTDSVFAAGDIARFPDWRTGDMIRIEHWRLAQQHGRIAACNMLGKKITFNSTPFFWTDLFGLRIQYVGYVGKYDEIIFNGDPSSRKFIAYYVKNDRVLASCGCGCDIELALIAELIRENKIPEPEYFRKGLKK